MIDTCNTFAYYQFMFTEEIQKQVCPGFVRVLLWFVNIDSMYQSYSILLDTLSSTFPFLFLGTWQITYNTLDIVHSWNEAVVFLDGLAKWSTSTEVNTLLLTFLRIWFFSRRLCEAMSCIRMKLLSCALGNQRSSNTIPMSFNLRLYLYVIGVKRRLVLERL